MIGDWGGGVVEVDMVYVEFFVIVDVRWRSG